VISAPLPVFLTLALVIVVSIELERRFAAARTLGSVLVAIVLAGVLSNAGVLPLRSEAYDMLGGVGVNLGIALVLLGVDVRSVLQAGPRMLAAFGLGAVGTTIGAVGGGFLASSAIGPETWKLAGQYAGTYIGGGVNMVSVGRALETDPDIFSAAVAADNVTTAVWMVVCIAAPVVLAPLWPRMSANQNGGAAQGVRSEEGPAPDSQVSQFASSRGPLTLKELALLSLLAAGAVWVSGVLAAWTTGVPQVLWLTTVALIAAQVPAVKSLSAGPVLGNYLLHLFLASLGAQSVVSEILRVGPVVFYFTVLVVLVHGLLLFGGGRVLRLDLPTLAVASQANVGGPASAMALATARGYADRLLPGVAVGLLGYAVGNYVGFGVAHLMRILIGT
jgi:uncharacterized membrane protein